MHNFNNEKLTGLLREAQWKETTTWSKRKGPIDAGSIEMQSDLVRAKERDEMVAYVLDICEREDMSLSFETFGLFVALLDRFLASYKVKAKYLECLAIACLYIACKVKEDDDNISVTAEFLLDCHCKCSVGELLRMEQTILSKFDWNVNDITAVDFMYIYHALLQNQCAQFNTQMNELVLFNLECKLKQVLCLSELTNSYRPNVLAFSLLALELESYAADEKLDEPLNVIRNMCKLTDRELTDACKEEVRESLAYLDNSRYLYNAGTWHIQYSHMMMHQPQQHTTAHASSSLFTLPNLSNNLDVIKEEDEEEEDRDGDDCKSVVTSVSTATSKSCNNSVVCGSEFVSYADVVLGRHERKQKRKRSSNSHSDEDTEYEY